LAFWRGRSAYGQRRPRKSSSKQRPHDEFRTDNRRFVTTNHAVRSLVSIILPLPLLFSFENQPHFVNSTTTTTSSPHPTNMEGSWNHARREDTQTPGMASQMSGDGSDGSSVYLSCESSGSSGYFSARYELHGAVLNCTTDLDILCHQSNMSLSPHGRAFGGVKI
jgi:hypothetical protein